MRRANGGLRRPGPSRAELHAGSAALSSAWLALVAAGSYIQSKVPPITLMSYKEELSSIELQARRQPLETAAALQLGLILFAFSRLDLHLRMLVEELDQPSLPTDTFRDRLDRLAVASQRIADAPLAAACQDWISQARGAGAHHDALLHGHWLPDLRRGLVLNVSAVTGRAVTTDYTVSDLEAMHRTLHELQESLQRFAASERQLRVAPDAG